MIDHAFKIAKTIVPSARWNETASRFKLEMEGTQGTEFNKLLITSYENLLSTRNDCSGNGLDYDKCLGGTGAPRGPL